MEQQRQSVTEQCVQEDLKLQAMDGSERAAEAAQEAQEALADIRDGADASVAAADLRLHPAALHRGLPGAQPGAAPQTGL